jgi:predicted nucleic acid-binding protein
MLLGNQAAPCLVAQNLYEFWVVATRPVKQNGLDLSTTQAVSELAKFMNQFALYDDTPAIRFMWEQLVVKYQVIGKNGHDARLVAAMIVHKIERLLTFNGVDFRRYKEIEVISPHDVVKSSVKGTP